MNGDRPHPGIVRTLICLTVAVVALFLAAAFAAVLAALRGQAGMGESESGLLLVLGTGLVSLCAAGLAAYFGLDSDVTPALPDVEDTADDEPQDGQDEPPGELADEHQDAPPPPDDGDPEPPDPDHIDQDDPDTGETLPDDISDGDYADETQTETEQEYRRG